MDTCFKNRSHYYWCRCCKDYPDTIVKVGVESNELLLEWDGHGYAYVPNPGDAKAVSKDWYCAWCRYGCTARGCAGALEFQFKDYQAGRISKRGK